MDYKDLKLPLRYGTKAIMRYMSLLFTLILCGYAVMVIFSQAYQNTFFLMKILPFLIIFYSINHIYRNIFTLKNITIKDNELVLFYLLKKKIIIKWENIIKIETIITPRRYFNLYFTNKTDEKIISIDMSFKNIIEILNYIKYFAPHIETDEFVSSLIFKIDSFEKSNEK